MCFSSQASFAAVAILSVTGAVAIKKARHPAHLAFAAIPLLFAAQQLFEGIFWLTQNGSISSEWETPSVIIFLVFAQVVWPFWVPYAMLRMENDLRRRRLLAILLGAGCLFSLYTIYYLFNYPVHGFVDGNHVAYKLDIPEGAVRYARMVLYLFATLLPPFLSNRRRMPLLAIALLISFLVSWLVFPDYIISTWCYFAAIISVIVVFILHSQKDTDPRSPTLPH